MYNKKSLVGRQPVLNKNLDIVAYELLFRSETSRESALVVDGNFASATVIINTLSEFGFERILGGKRGLINIETDLLMSDALEILPKERVVLELLETVAVTHELVERCKALKADGFSFALDDHCYDPIYKDLYNIVEIVKIDLLLHTDEELAAIVESLRGYPVKLLAEKVETHNEYLKCLDLGFELFQGYFFARPSLEEKKRIDETSSTLLKLLRLLNEDADQEAIEQTFRSRPGLTYKLLLLVNSVSLGLRQKVHTVRHAMAILGRQQIKRWVQLALFAADGAGGLTHPLVELAAVRAHFMELLACRHPQLITIHGSSEQAFMVGILSLLEAIYDISAEEIVTSLNLPHEVGAALTSRSGALGSLLILAEQTEQTYCRVPAEQFENAGLSQEDVQIALIKAYDWLASMQ
jgi:EAL and modified HD-GYP domain-containing signal transduction protein